MDFLTFEIVDTATQETVNVNAALLVITGLFIGFLVGLTGMGGGSLMTPILLLGFKMPLLTVIGTDIVYGAITKTFGAYRHQRLGTVNIRLALWMAIGSVPSSIMGVVFIQWLKENYNAELITNYLKSGLGVALVIVGVLILSRLLYVDDHVHPNYDGTSSPLSRQHRVTALLVGFFAGFLVGLTSVGSGSLIGLALLLLFPLSARRIVGTDVFHAAILLWAAGSAHFAEGNVSVPAVGALLIGSLPGVWIGSHLSVNVADKPLKAMLASVLALSGAKILGINTQLLLSLSGIAVVIVAIVLYRAYIHRNDPTILPEAPYDEMGTRDLDEITYPVPSPPEDDPKS